MEQSIVNWFHGNYKYKKQQSESNLSNHMVTKHLFKNNGMLQLRSLSITAFSLLKDVFYRGHFKMNFSAHKVVARQNFFQVLQLSHQ